MGRRELREHVFRLLFRVEFHDAEDLLEQSEFYVEHIKEPEDRDIAYITEKVQRITGLLPQIDAVINAAVSGWTTERMGKVELTIIRLALYEMKYDDDVPVSVAINEAVELTKKYGSDEAPSFVNGVLAKLA